MHSTNIAATNSATYGVPATSRPRPPSVVCTSAVTTMPSATARIDAPARTTVASPCSPSSREKNRRTPFAAVSPVAYRIAQMVTVNTRCSTSPPTVPIWPTSQVPALPA